MRAAPLLVATACLALGACDRPPPETPRPDGAALVCNQLAPAACPDPKPRYPDVEPIFQARCVPCHYGAQGGPWPLLQYSHVADWYDVIRDNMIHCTMPPADSGVVISDDERAALLTWIACGFPE